MAYVLITCELSREEKVLEKVSALPEVREAFIVYGAYDIVAIIEAESSQALKDTVFSKIRQTENVRSTTTLMVME